MKKSSNYITISELAILTGVNIKSLRYYDQVGVLKPAYCDPSSHYRYYTCSQVPIVHLIQFYIEADLPISELLQYIDSQSGSIRLRDPLFYGLATAQHKLAKLQSTISQAEAMLMELDHADQLLISEEPIVQLLPSKICYTLQIYGELSQTLYYTSLRHMLKEMQQNNLPLGYETGILNFRTQGQSQTFVYSTVNISQKDITDDTHFIKIPSQNFHCKSCDFSAVERKNLVDYFGKNNIPDLWILSEVYASDFQCNQPRFELRWGGI